ncbi:hypothetical protein [Zobellia uliginosa]|uniref:hypothetical protein n=1 Tax=Zobellia uliginosa TaxID=143224 RepID=UPI001C0674A8|nr:hypothetical protein [Zobellia uliginosa]MBU2947831.1 hypothetical protein [Zobellia uliginosa]
MKNKDVRFNVSLIALLVYEVALIVLALNGLSLSKLFFTSLVWVSFFIAGYEYVKNNKNIKKNIPYSAYIFLTILFIWNVFNVFRSLVNGTGTITTILGNVAGALSVLVPFVIIFSFEIRNLKNIHQLFFKILKFSIPLFVVLLILYNGSLSSIQQRSFLVLFLPVNFLITGLPYYSKKNQLLIMVSALLLVYVASLYSVRTIVIREVLLFIALLAVFIYSKFKKRWILSLSCLVLLAPFILLQQSYVTGESAFDIYLGGSSDSDLNVDTRTFLYTELFEDLQNTNTILIGKGANGSYYSDYFNSLGEDETDIRNNIEVGILGMLLKGGLIAVFFNFGILFIAIYVAFFKSKNLYTIGLGYMLLIHTVLLFLENYIVYSEYNFAIWFFTGVCLSKSIRNMSDTEIRMFLQGKIRIR